VQLINIKYNVDKSTVDTSNASVERAKQLTDQLKNSAQQMASQAQRGNQQYASSIESVRVRMAQLRAQIELTSRSDTQRLNKLIADYRAAKSEVDKFNQSLNAQEKAAGNSTNAFMGMYNAVRLIIGAGLTRWLVDTTLEMAKLQGNTEAVGRAFHRQITNSENLLFRLRNATKGTVGDIELMQRALKFQNFGADVQRLPELLEFAAVRAQQTGESIDYMVNSIVDGIGRKSILKLDNLGISASRLKDQFNGVALQSLSVAEVTRGVADIMKEELDKMGGYAETSATKVDQITVAWQELRVELSKKIESGGLLDFFKDTIEGGKATIRNFTFDVLKFFGRLREEAVRTEAVKQALEDVERIRKDNNGTLQEQYDLIQQEINSRVQVIGKYNDTINALKREHEELGKTDPYSKRRDEIIKTLYAYNSNKIVIEETIKALIGYREEVEKLMQPQEAQIVTLKTLKDELAELEKIREEQTSINDKAELDRLQRLINLKEQQILKISDTIKYQKYWNDISKETIKIQDQLNETLNKRLEGEAMDFFENMFKKNGKVDTSGIDLEGIEIPVEIAPPSWEGGNEKAARFRLAMKQFMKDNQDDIIGEGISFTTDLLQTAVDLELAHYEQRLANLQNFYDRQNLLAGDNERYKKELAIRQQRDTLKLEREQANAQKKARRLSIVIDTAASIARAWVNPGYPGAIALTGFLAAQGAAQLAIVNKTVPGFKDGVIDLKGPGTTKSDSIPAWLSRGESVMTAEETQGSINTLKAIRAKKIDDKKLERIVAQAKGRDGAVFDDSRLASIMSKVAQNTASTDLVRKGTVIYEVKQYGDTLKKYIKSKY
jgi:hypothetical protein